MLRNLTFVVQFAYFSIRPKTFCYFEQLLSNFLRYYGKMFGKSSPLMQNFGAQTGIMRDVQMVQRGKKKSENFELDVSYLFLNVLK